jgi:hypothetical protein
MNGSAMTQAPMTFLKGPVRVVPEIVSVRKVVVVAGKSE